MSIAFGDNMWHGKIVARVNSDSSSTLVGSTRILNAAVLEDPANCTRGTSRRDSGAK